MSKNYNKQDRGTISAYQAYFAGMDASMKQKIALTTAHFPTCGKIADMGSGSGRGSFDLATLYESLEIIGVDINEVSIEQSKQSFSLPNLIFQVGDISEQVFEKESLDGILNSSVLHHVTSFNAFDINQIHKTLENQITQLKKGGVLIIRDFVVPKSAEKTVFLDLPNNDGKESGEIPEISTAKLFKIFAENFRSSLNLQVAVPFQKLSSPKEGFTRFEVSLRFATEFALRKDYRDHWEPELLEEYTYFSQSDFEKAFENNSLRIIVSMPLWNPWIIENRFKGKFFLSETNNKPLQFPPTNYLIVGEKVEYNEGVKIIEHQKTETETSFLQLKSYRNRETETIYELAERPNKTIDLLPWFLDDDGQLFILAKKDFPRPLVNASANNNLNYCNYSGYLTEPISAIFNDSSDSKTSGIFQILDKRANLPENQILEISEPQFYFPSAGGINEQVESFLVEIAETTNKVQVIENYTPFTSAGTVRELDALQVLRASHVGGMFDARLEINIYRLLRKLNISAGYWIGAEIKAAEQQFVEVSQKPDISDLFSQESKVFEPFEISENKFLNLVKADFAEINSKNEILAKAEFEYVIPQNLSKNTVTTIPFFQSSGKIFVGIEVRQLPAPQNFTNNANLVCVPAWRLPQTIENKFLIEEFLRRKMLQDFDVEIKNMWELGGSYFTSPGITPEIVYPCAVEISVPSIEKSSLMFFDLQNMIKHFESFQDAHLLISLNRLNHALS